MKFTLSLLKIIAVIASVLWVICAVSFFFPDSFIFREVITISLALTTSCSGVWFCAGLLASMLGGVVMLITTVGFLVVIGLWIAVALIDKGAKNILNKNKYLFWAGFITVALIILPIIWLAFAIPQSVNLYRTTDSPTLLNWFPLPTKWRTPLDGVPLYK